MPEGLDPELRALLAMRAGGLCELCGLPHYGLWDPQHRVRRSHGRLDSVENLLVLHRLCHRRADTHPAWSYQHGFLVRSTEDPALMPVALHCERWVLLTSDGGYLDTDPPAGVPLGV